MSLLHIHLFQRFDVSCETTELEGLTAQKACELICFLLTFRHRAHHRELLASQLWEHGSSANAKKNLRQVLWQINSKLTDIKQTHGFEFLVTDQEWIQVNPDANLWLDVAEFEQAYQSVKSVRGQELTQTEAELLACAVRLYRGHLLEGWYQDWCLAERERLHNIYLILLDKLLSYSEEEQDYEAGIQYGALALRSDPARERTHRRLMRLHYGAGHRSAALQQYEACVAALRDDLAVEPGQRTKTLYEEMRNERFGVVTIGQAGRRTAQHGIG